MERSFFARYRYSQLETEPEGHSAERGRARSSTCGTWRWSSSDSRGASSRHGRRTWPETWANTLPGYLTATDFADLAVSLADHFGLEVETFHKQQLDRPRLRGLLGVNAVRRRGAGRMIGEHPNTPRAAEPDMVIWPWSARALMYDFRRHQPQAVGLDADLAMKMDMGGAASGCRCPTALRDLGSTTAGQQPSRCAPTTCRWVGSSLAMCRSATGPRRVKNMM